MTLASYLVWDLVTAQHLWDCAVYAWHDGDHEVAAYFMHILADLASA